MDNFSLNVTAEGITSLKLAMELAFAHNAPGSKVTHYSVREPKEGQRQDKPEGVPKHWDAPWSYNQEPRPRRLIFFWHKPEDSQADVVALPFSLDAAGAADFAARWLREAEFGREPDHDGDNGRGWRAWVEGWGHVDGSFYAVVATSQQEVEGLAAKLTEAQRKAIIHARDCGYFYVADVVPGDPWPEGVAQFLTLKGDRLTTLGNRLRSHLIGTGNG